MSRTPFLALLLAAAVAGCSAGRGSDGPRRDFSVLTQQEIQAAHYVNLYDAVDALRSNWIRRRGPASLINPHAGQVTLFMEGVRLGDVGYLRLMHVSGVASLRFLNINEASARFGLQANSGPAIVVIPSPGP
jgi:hypothetical protein